MITSPSPSAASISTSPITTSSPASRTTGMRSGLHFLRNYTHNLHLHGDASIATRSVDDPPAAPFQPHSPNSPPTTTPPTSPNASAASRGSTARPNILARTHTAPVPPSPTSLDAYSLPVPPATMTRIRSETAAPQLLVRNHSGPTPATSSPAVGGTSGQPGDTSTKPLPSIRFTPHSDPRAARPSLHFSVISRTLPDESAVIRVGRYSERDGVPEIPTNVPSAAAVGFKSKVVSRKHCELWCKDGNWYIKDVKSSSGTFLNHIRLSQPNIESKPFRLKDGDIIQLGIDFRGGEEMIFRCVKIRVECNRGWQQALNNFNKQTHLRLRNLGKAAAEGDNKSLHSSECSICLMSIAPCQSLFVAPCSHVWHYKCIRPILNGPTAPNFLCPNCRAVTDLEADVEDLGDYGVWEDDNAQSDSELVNGDNNHDDHHIIPQPSTNGLTESGLPEITSHNLGELEAAMSNVNISTNSNDLVHQPADPPATPMRPPPPAPASSVTQPVSINISGVNDVSGLTPLFNGTTNSLGPERLSECPMTPRNDAGPFVLDGSGSAGRSSGPRIRDASEETQAS